MKPDSTTRDSLPQIIIVGGGFGGLAAARALKHAHAQVDLIDKTNHHVFQPLLYQVATGILSPEHIAAPLRRVLGKQRNTIVLKETVIAVDAEKKLCVVEGVMAGAPVSLPYDYLVLATGVQTSYFGNNDYIPFAGTAPGKAGAAPIQIFRQRQHGHHRSDLRGDGVGAHPHVRVLRQNRLGLHSRPVPGPAEQPFQHDIPMVEVDADWPAARPAHH
jgi:hypothetical protein